MPFFILGGPWHVWVRHALLVSIGCLQIALVIHCPSSQLPLVREEVAVCVGKAAGLALQRAVHGRVDSERAAVPARCRPICMISYEFYNWGVATLDLGAGRVCIARVATIVHSNLTAACMLSRCRVDLSRCEDLEWSSVIANSQAGCARIQIDELLCFITVGTVRRVGLDHSGEVLDRAATGWVANSIGGPCLRSRQGSSVLVGTCDCEIVGITRVDCEAHRLDTAEHIIRNDQPGLFFAVHAHETAGT